MIKNLATFERKLGEFSTTLTETQMPAFMKKIVLELLVRVVGKTDVDTGRMRGGWQVQILTPDDEDIERLDKNGADTVNLGAEVMKRWNLGETVYIVNNVFYVIYHEEGTDKIAPRKMMERSIQELEAVFN